MHTPSVTAENVEKLAALFPSCVTETKNEKTGQLKRAIDFDQLRQELSDHVVDGPRERYHLDWPGKREALLAANAPIAKALRPCREESVDFDTTKHLFIEGDNLDALRLLQESYLGKVSLIYIDPPYNTGNDFIYADDFTADLEVYQHKAGEKDEEGRKLIDEARWKQNSVNNGRFHSDWLTMMYSRLRVSANLLSEDGLILVSIDDGEIANLRKIGDEIFGPDNFVATFIWEGGRKNDARLVSNGHDFMACWAKSREFLQSKSTKWRERKNGLAEIYKKEAELRAQHLGDFEACRKEMLCWFNDLAADHPSAAHKHFSYFDNRGIYFPDNLRSPNPRPNLVFDWKGYKPHPNGWGYGKERMKQLDDQDRLHYPETKDGRIKIKSYLHEHETWAPNTVFYQDRRVASKRLAHLLGPGIFPFPKDENVIARFISTTVPSDALILDFFSGSSSTAHAVMKINAEDGGKRRHIMVQLPEPCDEKSDAYKAGYKSIADIGKERIRRAGKLILEEWKAKREKGSSLQADLLDTQSAPDIGFRVLKIDTSNMAEVYHSPDAVKQIELVTYTENIRADRTPEDLLFQVLVDWGLDLAYPIEQQTIAGKTVFFVDGNALAACFDTNISEDLVKELAKRKPLRAVFRDSSYDSDSTKINVDQIFKLLSPETEVKTL